MAPLRGPSIRAKASVSCCSRTVNAELHASKRTPWSLKRAPAVGLKKEGEMLFLPKRGPWRPLQDRARTAALCGRTERFKYDDGKQSDSFYVSLLISTERFY